MRIINVLYLQVVSVRWCTVPIIYICRRKPAVLCFGDLTGCGVSGDLHYLNTGTVYTIQFLMCIGRPGVCNSYAEGPDRRVLTGFWYFGPSPKGYRRSREGECINREAVFRRKIHHSQTKWLITEMVLATY